jgi:hypothetical protein
MRSNHRDIEVAKSVSFPRWRSEVRTASSVAVETTLRTKANAALTVTA